MPDVRRFYDAPHLDRLTTRVVAAGTADGRPFVRLDETIFYPEGGGQPADHGRIGEAAVVDVIARGGEVLHFLDRPLGEGEAGTVLDTVRRFDHCQQHTAQHLLSAILLDRHGLPTTSFHLGAAYTAIEVAGAVPIGALRTFEREVNLPIREGRRVTTRWVEPEALATLPVRSRGLPDGHRGAVRLVEIEGLDLNTCGGTHVDHLGEIQAIELLDAEPARGGTRLRFLAGERVFASLERRRALEAALKERIGTAPAEFVSVLDGWEAERRRLDRRVREVGEQLADAVAAQIAGAAGPYLCAVRPGATPDELRSLAAAVVRLRPDAVAVLAGEGCFLVQAGADGPGDVAATGARVRDLLGAKGGGRGKTFQGKGGTQPSLDDLIEATE
ncbi:MAG TPA: alanyl-tRNA editing protein [Candidatus Polarisedimenticolaceae bacterium]|nr:alanyl-tRNA editing protein [Candidatus Polarisedimenticolaceae bacterium]